MISEAKLPWKIERKKATSNGTDVPNVECKINNVK